MHNSTFELMGRVEVTETGYSELRATFGIMTHHASLTHAEWSSRPFLFFLWVSISFVGVLSAKKI